MINSQIEKYKKCKKEIEDIENSVEKLELSINIYHTHIHKANAGKEELLKKKEIYVKEFNNYNIIESSIKEIKSFIFDNNLLNNSFYFIKECVGEDPCLVNYQLLNIENDFFKYRVIKIYDDLEISKKYSNFNLSLIIKKHLEYFLNNEFRINKSNIRKFFDKKYFVDELYKNSSDFCYDFLKVKNFHQKKKIIELIKEVEENKNV